MSTGPRRRRNPALFRALIAASLLYLIALPVGLLMVVMSPMTADFGTGPVFNTATTSLPAALVLCPAAGWIAYARGRDGIGWAASMLPLAWVPVLLIALHIGV